MQKTKKMSGEAIFLIVLMIVILLTIIGLRDVVERIAGGPAQQYEDVIERTLF